MEWSEKNLCIRCNKGGNLLLCSEDGCPISVHEECMGCPARFNDAGNFYCPYCFYKEAISESCRARKEAMEKKKALLIFIGEEPKNGEMHLDQNEKSKGKRHDQSKDFDVNFDIQSMGNVGEDAVSDKSDNEERIRDDGEDSEEETIQEQDDSETSSVDEDENSGASSESKDQDPSFQLHGKPKEDDEMIEDDDSEGSSESFREVDSSVRVCLRSNKGGVKRSLADEADDDTVAMQSKHTKSTTCDKDKQTHEETVDTPRRSSRRRSSSGLGNDEVSDEDADWGLEQPQQEPSVKPARRMFGNAKKRKPLLWSQKEEEKLEKGVSKYSEPDKKIPWKKILDYGRKVFHSTRTPTDLKDKWRKMLAAK